MTKLMTFTFGVPEAFLGSDCLDRSVAGGAFVFSCSVSVQLVLVLISNLFLFGLRLVPRDPRRLAASIMGYVGLEIGVSGWNFGLVWICWVDG